MTPPNQRYGAAVGDLANSRGQAVVHPTLDNWLSTATTAQEDDFNQLVYLTAVDYLDFNANRCLPTGILAERYEVVAGLMCYDRRERLRLRVQVPESKPEIPTLFDLWPGAENLEREVYDMFGIVFTGHPDLTRILMPEDWAGHPLRKDYDTGWIPVQFSATTNSRR
ncbi:MAG: NADH-quinone oxidoreductase subunit C [Acidimicrobiaceae bacterium]|nr:NADH-quinone oxidoreductase subunit C [Acidimicrobiaceae bacterium]